jgi:hypothetical protein
MKRRATRAIPKPAAARPVVASASKFVVTHVRQALQQTAAVGAFSPYFPAI